MTSTACHATWWGPKGHRRQRAEGSRAVQTIRTAEMILHVRRPEFADALAAAAAGRDELAVADDEDSAMRRSPASAIAAIAPASAQEPLRIGGVLDVAAGIDRAARAQRRADLEARIGRIGVAARLGRRRTSQASAISALFDIGNAEPCGGIALPMKPASSTTVRI